MFERNYIRFHFFTVAAMAAFSMMSFIACGDDVVNTPNPSTEPVADEPSADSVSTKEPSKPRDCDDEGLTVGSICVKREVLPGCRKPGCALISHEYVYMGDGILEDFDAIANKTACTPGNEGAKQELTYGDESYKKTQYYRCTCHWPSHDAPAYDWLKVDEVAYNCAVKFYNVGFVSAAPAGEICSFESSEGMQNYLSVYNLIEKKNVWSKFEPNSELGPCPNEYTFGRLFSKSGENVYKCDLGEWALAEGLVPQQYLDPRKDNLTDEEYDVLELPQNASVGDRAAGLLEDCTFKKDFLYFTCDSENANGPCPKHVYYDDCEPRNYYRYRENGLWTLETDEDRLNDSRFQQPECTEENKDSVFEIPPQPGEPGKVYKCIWNSATVIFGKLGVNRVFDYVFHKAEKVNLF